MPELKLQYQLLFLSCQLTEVCLAISHHNSFYDIFLGEVISSSLSDISTFKSIASLMKITLHDISLLSSFHELFSLHLYVRSICT